MLLVLLIFAGLTWANESFAPLPYPFCELELLKPGQSIVVRRPVVLLGDLLPALGEGTRFVLLRDERSDGRRVMTLRPLTAADFTVNHHPIRVETEEIFDIRLFQQSRNAEPRGPVVSGSVEVRATSSGLLIPTHGEPLTRNSLPLNVGSVLFLRNSYFAVKRVEPLLNQRFSIMAAIKYFLLEYPAYPALNMEPLSQPPLELRFSYGDQPTLLDGEVYKEPVLEVGSIALDGNGRVRSVFGMPSESIGFIRRHEVVLSDFLPP